jgi:hypothetical protein
MAGLRERLRALQQARNGNVLTLAGGVPTWASTSGTYLPLAGGTMTGDIVSHSIQPGTDDTYVLGDSTHHFTGLYTQNVTFSPDAGTARVLTLHDSSDVNQGSMYVSTSNVVELEALGTLTLQGVTLVDIQGPTSVSFGALSVNDGFKIKEGTNESMGVATLSGGTVTVTTTAVGANSRIFLPDKTERFISALFGFLHGRQELLLRFQVPMCWMLETLLG